MCINHVAANECQRCKEQEKKNREANEQLAKKDQEIIAMRNEMTAMKEEKKKENEMTAMKEELKKKEKEMTAMKEEKKKKEKEMTAMKEEIQITETVLDWAYTLEHNDKIIINQKSKDIKENNLLIEELKEEIQRLITSDQTFCHICCEEKIQVVFIPCGHLYSCRKCTVGLPTPNCPMCRAQIREYQDIFWA